MQKLVREGNRVKALQEYKERVLAKSPLMLRRWLLNDFKDPRRWLQARTLFVETHALWSMMGYISFRERVNRNDYDYDIDVVINVE